MKRLSLEQRLALILAAMLLLMGVPGWSQTTTVSGKLQTYNPLVAPNALGNYVEFQLTNCGNNTPVIGGSAVLLNKAIDFYPDTTGALTAASNGGITPTLYGNDVINCGGAFTSRYSVRYFVGGIAQGPAKFYFVTSTAPFNLTTATPINLQPPLNPPYPNLTTCAPGSYTNGLNKDLSVKCLNLPSGASNAVVTNPTATQEIGNQPLVLDGPISGVSAAFKSTNGLVNATLFPGGDFGAQVNAAMASCSDILPCHVVIPPGVYSYATPVLLPRRTQGLEVTCDRNATLTYTGTGDAFGTQPQVFGGTNLAQTILDGGCALIGTSAANSGVHFRPGQGFTLRDWQISGFTAGDGIWVDGVNVAEISGTTSKGNLNGIHITGNMCNGANQCMWDRSAPGTWVNSGVSGVSGFAPNAISGHNNKWIGNAHWGILGGDIVGGSVSQAFNNSFVDNDLEGNGTAGAPYGAALFGFSRATTFERNYLEGNPNGIFLGCVGGTPAGVVAPTGYTAQFCGTADKAVVSKNFLNDVTTASEVNLEFANSPSVTDNALNGAADCLVDNNVSAGNISIHGNQVYGGGAMTCQNGTPGGTLVNYRFEGDSTIPGQHFFGTTQVDGTFSTGTLTKLNTGQSTMPVGGVIILQIGSINVWQGSTPPAGSCGASGNIWFTNTDMYICSGTWRLVTHS
jgi:hypothetical protein